MEEQQIGRILSELGSREPQQAWDEFLEGCTPVILQVIGLFERDTDHVCDCFLFVCEKLSRNRFRRLRKFRLRGPARFTTWLRAVVRNLCLDWHRQEFGRQRVFQSIARLSVLDGQVFQCVYEQGASLEEVFLRLRPRFPGLAREQLAESHARIEQALTPRQHWLLRVRAHRAAHPAEPAGEEALPQVPDSRPDPETLVSAEEGRAALARALARLPASERLLIRLRFEQELTLEQVARLAGLGDAQRADRRIREVLDRLRKELT